MKNISFDSETSPCQRQSVISSRAQPSDINKNDAETGQEAATKPVEGAPWNVDLVQDFYSRQPDVD